MTRVGKDRLMGGVDSVSEIKKLGVVIPVFNDWLSAGQLVSEFNEAFRIGYPTWRAHFVLVDDGSTDGRPPSFYNSVSDLSLEIIHLSANQGHQRAIVAGLRHIQNQPISHVLVMDSDGEDTPSGAVELMHSLSWDLSTVVVAQRGLRSEKLSFRLLYRAYKTLFSVLVGLRLDFGNFAVMPVGVVGKILSLTDSASHLPSTILRSGLPIKRVRIDRGLRYFGKSKMNLERLVAHSFASLAVFSDRIMIRMMIFSFLSTAAISIGIVAVLVIRFLVDGVTPGWATAAVGLLAVIAIQILGFVGLGTLITINLNSLKNLYSTQGPSYNADKQENL
jgi:glycosyltransferase involved in cell wall biosynthesis